MTLHVNLGFQIGSNQMLLIIEGEKRSALIFNIIYIFPPFSNVVPTCCYSLLSSSPLFIFLPASVCNLLFGAVWTGRRADQAQGWEDPSSHSGCDANLLDASEEFQPLRLWCPNILLVPEAGRGDGVVLQQRGPSWVQPPPDAMKGWGMTGARGHRRKQGGKRECEKRGWIGTTA